jgi:hypothetical protein
VVNVTQNRHDGRTLRSSLLGGRHYFLNLGFHPLNLETKTIGQGLGLVVGQFVGQGRSKLHLEHEVLQNVIVGHAHGLTNLVRGSAPLQHQSAAILRGQRIAQQFNDIVIDARLAPCHLDSKLG